MNQTQWLLQWEKEDIVESKETEKRKRTKLYLLSWFQGKEK
jgi:hypothetical protein